MSNVIRKREPPVGQAMARRGPLGPGEGTLVLEPVCCLRFDLLLKDLVVLEAVLTLALLVGVEALVDAVLRLLATLGEAQVHGCDGGVFFHPLLQLLATILGTCYTH